MNEQIFEFYSKPTQYGGAMPYFIGERYNQIGGGFLSNVGRYVLPILKTIGKNLLGIGAEVANDVVNKNVDVKRAISNRTRKRLKCTINNVENDIFTKFKHVSSQK